MIVILQDSPDWALARLGKLTASRIADATARTKTGWGASRANLMADLIAERLTGDAAQGYTNAAMQWGLDHEDGAKAAYEFRFDAPIAPGGYVDHPAIAMSGASPDGFIGDHGLVEIKCPMTSTHLDTLLSQSVEGKYIKQVQWQLACTGRAWCDFISYDPRLPEAMSLFVKRVPRDDGVIAELEAAAVEFLGELDAKLAKLRALYDRREAA